MFIWFKYKNRLLLTPPIKFFYEHLLRWHDKTATIYDLKERFCFNIEN